MEWDECGKPGGYAPIDMCKYILTKRKRRSFSFEKGRRIWFPDVWKTHEGFGRWSDAARIGPHAPEGSPELFREKPGWLITPEDAPEDDPGSFPVSLPGTTPELSRKSPGNSPVEYTPQAAFGPQERLDRGRVSVARKVKINIDMIRRCD